MQIKMMGLKDIKPYEKNPRKNDKSVEFVANSIKEFGFKVPIVIDKDGVIVCGHTRYKAAKKLKMQEVPCIMADDLTDKQIKAFRLADNKVGESSEWDDDLLDDELALLDDDFDMDDFGFEDDSIMDSLDDEDFSRAYGDDLQEFSVSFVFPVTDKDVVKNYIKKHGKDYISGLIIREALADA